MTSKSEPRPFVGRLIFDNGQVCEGVEGTIGEDVDPRHGNAGRKVYGGFLWTEWTRATIEVLGRQATLQTAGGLKARIAFKGVLDEEEEPGATIEFNSVGSPVSGSFDQP